jgi:hypothetical protein
MVSRVGPIGNGLFTWSVTFLGNPGPVALLGVDGSSLTGSSARVTVSEVTRGVAASLTGASPTLSVAEVVAGRPDYTGSYTSPSIGSYLLAVRQLTGSGLHADYFDNMWLQGTPVVSRIDAVLNFTWGTGLVTPYGADYVSVRWAGKFKAPTAEPWTFYLTANDGARHQKPSTAARHVTGSPGMGRSEYRAA